MKLRLLPILVSLIITSGMLFGGWFVYHSAALVNPLTDTVRQIPGVAHAAVEIQNEAVDIELKLEPDASLRAVMERLRKEAASLTGERKLNIRVVNESSAELDEWWSLSLFDVAQAMETKRYGDIPRALSERSAQLPGLEAVTEMDEEYVYVRLRKGDDSKFVLLPRIPETLGVWPNE
jgi:hypothetical protein